MIPKNFDSQFSPSLLRLPGVGVEKQKGSPGIKFPLLLLSLLQLLWLLCYYYDDAWCDCCRIPSLRIPSLLLLHHHHRRGQPLAASVGVMQICIQLSTFTRHKMKCDNQIRATTMRSKGRTAARRVENRQRSFHGRDKTLALPVQLAHQWPRHWAIAIAAAIRVPVYAILIVL